MTADTVGGVWTYCIELCKSLAEYNVQFHVVTTGALMKPWQKQEIETLNNVVVHEKDFLLEWMNDPWNDIDESGKWLLQLEREVKPNIIHLNGYSYAALQWKAPCIVVAHSDVCSWWLAVKNEMPPAEWKEYYQRVKDGLQYADLIVAPSHAMLNYINQIYAPQGDAKVIYNARSSEHFYRSQKQQTIFSMGRIWDEGKNIQLLVDAAPNINCKIKIAGDNNFNGDSIQLEQTNIEYLGKLNTQQVADELSRASVFVMPARYEPFGLSALEAALSGCALVLGDTDSLREIWQDNALFVNTDDAVALAETINTLMNDKAMLEQYANKAYEHSKNYSTTIMANQYLRTYRKLLEQHAQLKTPEAIR